MVINNYTTNSKIVRWVRAYISCFTKPALDQVSLFLDRSVFWEVINNEKMPVKQKQLRWVRFEVEKSNQSKSKICIYLEPLSPVESAQLAKAATG